MKVVFVASGVILAVLGIVGIVIGAILPNIVDDQIIKGLEEAMPRDIDDKEIICKDACEESSKPNDIYVYNITNAKDVLTGSKPIVTEHKFSFTVYETDYSVDYDKKTDSIGKRSFSRYVPNNEEDYNTEFITVNPVYVGASAGAAGSENGLIYGAVVPGVLGKIFGNVPSIATAVAIQSVSSYWQGVMAFCMAGVPAGKTTPAPGGNPALAPNCLGAFNAGAENVSTVNGLAGPVLVGTITGMTSAGAKYGADIAPKFDGFSLAAAVDVVVLSNVLANENSEWGMKLGAAKWVAVVTALGLMDAAGAAGFAELRTQAIAYALTQGATLSEADFATIAGYWGAVATNLDFRNEVLSMTAVIGDAQYYEATNKTALLWKEPVNTFDDLVYSQYGSGALSAATGDATVSLGPQIGLPPFEFFAHQAKADGEAITGVEAKALLSAIAGKTFSVASFCPTGAAAFGDYLGPYGNTTGGDNGTALAAFAAGDPARGIPTGIGLTKSNAQVYLGYICTYVPTAFFSNAVYGQSPVQEDGTYATNGGLFVKRSLKEIMHGYEDPFYGALSLPQDYGGLISTTATLAEAKANDEASGMTDKKDRQKAGRDNLDEIDYWVEKEGLTKFALITDLGEECPNPAVPAYSTGLASECKMWASEEQIAGVPDTRWPPLKEEDPVEEFEFYVHDLKRSVQVEKDEEEIEFRDIRMVRYRLKDSENKAAADVTGAEAKKRAEKYVTPISGFIDLQRSSGMVPILIGFPRHAGSKDEAAKIEGFPVNDDDITTYFDVEPLTGVMMGAHKRLQYNVLLKSSNFDFWDGYKDMLPAGEQIAFPILWLDDYNFIGEEDAASFNEAIFDVRTQMKTVSLVAIIISVVNVVAGAALVLIGINEKNGDGKELSNRSR